MGRGRGLALCLAVLLCLSGCVLTQEKPLENPQAQAIVDAVQAIPDENLQVSLYNPLAVEGTIYALATGGAAAKAEADGFTVVTCEQTHQDAFRAILADMTLTRVAESARTDGGASLTLRLYDGETLVQRFTLREGQLEAATGGVSYYFSIDPQASALLMEAVGRQPK